MSEEPAKHNGASNGHERPHYERAHWRQVRKRLDELMRVQTRENLRNLDPRRTAIWTAGTLLGIASWLFVIWFGVRWLG